MRVRRSGADLVPLGPIGGWLTLSVTLAPADTLRFTLDTGAARSAVSSNAARRLGLVATRSYTVQGASGPATVSATRLDELRFAGITLRELEVLILEDRVLTLRCSLHEQPDRPVRAGKRDRDRFACAAACACGARRAGCSP